MSTMNDLFRIQTTFVATAETARAMSWFYFEGETPKEPIEQAQDLTGVDAVTALELVGYGALPKFQRETLYLWGARCGLKATRKAWETFLDTEDAKVDMWLLIDKAVTEFC